MAIVKHDQPVPPGRRVEDYRQCGIGKVVVTDHVMADGAAGSISILATWMHLDVKGDGHAPLKDGLLADTRILKVKDE